MNISKIRSYTNSVLKAANYDFCPQFNRYVYWLKEPVGWVITAILFSLLVGLAVGPQGYVLTFAFLALLILGLAWPWVSMKGIGCELVLPDGRLWENQEAKIVFQVRNYWPIPVFGLMIEGDFLQDYKLDEECIAFSLTKVPALSETRFEIPITPRRRGCLPSGEVRIKSGFPFGLVDISKNIATPNHALVWPESETLDGHPPATGNLFSAVGSLKDQSGNDGDTIGVRTYRPGDRLRNIHWAQTVRSNRLMVRERQKTSSTSATILVDLLPDHHVGEGVHSSFEWAIRIAGTICYQLHQSRSPVQVLCVGLPAELQRTSDNRYGIQNLMDFLARIPTLEHSRESEEPLVTVPVSELPLSGDGQVFVVGTNRSSFEGPVADVKSIVIELSGFSADSEKVNGNELSPLGGIPEITVSAPELAGDQLVGGWRRSFGCVSC